MNEVGDDNYYQSVCFYSKKKYLVMAADSNFASISHRCILKTSKNIEPGHITSIQAYLLPQLPVSSSTKCK